MIYKFINVVVILFDEKNKESFYNSCQHYLLKVNNRNNRRRRCKICLKLTIKAPKRLQLRLSVAFLVDF